MATIDESLVPRMPPGVNVLVVEDAQPVRDLTVAALEHAGCRVFAAVDGPNGVAVAAACTDRIDLLVTDVAMPGFGGHELATRLFATRPGLRVLYISGYTQDSVVLQGVTHSGINFLAKPFTVGELLAKVVEVLADQPVG
jgi:CheY-like chemotaxis protein